MIMGEKPYNIIIASDVSRDVLTAEIWMGDDLFAIVLRDGGRYDVEIFASDSGQPWQLDLNTIFEAMSQAKRELGGAQSSVFELLGGRRARTRPSNADRLSALLV